jgi:hypothetical protein
LNRGTLQRLLREPLFHFIAIGGLFFWVYSALNGGISTAPDTIVVSAERITQIKVGFNSVWKRMPSEDELGNLLEEEIREEVYYRDALALGLDKNDAMVRRRLRQKMEFLGDTGSFLQEPSEGELKAFYKTNRIKYQREPQLAFEQLFLGENPEENSIRETLESLLSDPAADLSELGKRSLLPSQLRLSGAKAVNSVFGQGFFEQLAQIPPGAWGGPVSSTYGIHLVRTLDGKDGELPPLSDVREAVVRDWKNAKVLEVREQDYAQRRARYKIVVNRNSDPQSTAVQ